MDQAPIQFPSNLPPPSAMTLVRRFEIEQDKIACDENVVQYLYELYDNPEYKSFVFAKHGHSFNEFFEKARPYLDFIEVQNHFYRHPLHPRNFEQVYATTAEHQWELDALKTPMYSRYEFKLSAKARRDIEHGELIKKQQEANSNPFMLQPNLSGVGIDLVKLFPWLHTQFATGRLPLCLVWSPYELFFCIMSLITC